MKLKYNMRKVGAAGYAKGSPNGSMVKFNEGQEFIKTADHANRSRQRKKKSQNKKDSTTGSLLFGSGFTCGSQLITSTTKKSYP